jgi:hypothetical protein
VILSDDEIVDNCIDNGTGSSGDNYVEPRDSDSHCAKDTMSDGYYCTEMDTIDICFHWNRQDEVVFGKISAHIRRRW